MTRQEAIVELLSRPDEPCLAGKRNCSLTQPGDRDADVIKRELGRAYLLHRWHDHKDVSAVVASRRLKIVRRA